MKTKSVLHIQHLGGEGLGGEEGFAVDYRIWGSVFKFKWEEVYIQKAACQVLALELVLNHRLVLAYWPQEDLEGEVGEDHHDTATA